MSRRKKGRSVSGILVLDKPQGMTSNSVLQKVKHLFQAQKAGHTGSLDPLATGVLPICLGEATKVSHYLLDSDKRYRAICQLGFTTSTGDSDGDRLDSRPVPELNKQQLIKLLQSFEGEQEQTPPMFSALKHQGRPLYEYARQGIHIERKARPITIFEIQLIDFVINADSCSSNSFIEIEVHCSKGTYIRTLCEDIGQAIGCGAHISALRRIASGSFSLAQSISIDDLYQDLDPAIKRTEEQLAQLDKSLLATETAIETLPAITINALQYQQIRHGMPLAVHELPSAASLKFVADQHYRIYFQARLLAIAVLVDEAHIRAKRLLFL